MGITLSINHYHHYEEPIRHEHDVIVMHDECEYEDEEEDLLECSKCHQMVEELYGEDEWCGNCDGREREEVEENQHISV
jgi:hypothetical protein